ncbi:MULTISPECIES: molybdate ABC transporter substrate-binding protein [Bacillus]|uniref:Molybdate ABC transporter substrate-binding protein n=1 Tax=Bacillus glycinifermentans TaxID=1664069 RepID=A0AAJ4D273_9BACI|nr:MULTISPECIES: molybdate ABC transporter substrate-binding protein [Bacillus]KKB73425.1 molybdenum ABC transporter substrate-binding protein [Bacillus sp. TH008]MBU8787431.1 molybdate ABC transporter substrate-binding protein [Bacillus glycinifermentans]MDU0069636.1 molybdate ABC transporter substrate-binding protein [Bacillus sp. IG6]MED8017385.1 molybdate ABC transporter substrate-binding protein [Bacillus glycinifermentans]NUJ17062.1 molybdate ABC transporter substrate-binding protein [Ba
MKKTLLLVMTMLLAFALFGCQAGKDASGKDQSEDVQLTVSAAASLKDVLTELSSEYKKDHPNVTVKFNFGSSGALQQQIEQGAPADLFFSAAQDKFDRLVEQGLISKSDSVNLLENSLVLIVPKEKAKQVKSFEDLTKSGVDKLAVGKPESVPAGKYAKETLTSLHLWSKVQSKIVYGKDVRQVLSYVETGNADAGAVYRTDALTSDQVKAVETAASDLHTPIVYPLGIVKNTKHREQAEQFYKFLQSDESVKKMEKYGFKKG